MSKLYQEGPTIDGNWRRPVSVVLESMETSLPIRGNQLIYLLSWKVHGPAKVIETDEGVYSSTLRESGRTILQVPKNQSDPDAYAIREAIQFANGLYRKYQPEKLGELER